MKTWAVTFLTALLIAGAAKLLLPKGEKSPLYRPLRFLTALLLLLILCHPLLKIVRDPNAYFSSGFTEADESADYDPGAHLLEQSENRIEKSVREAFPEGDYELVFETDEEELGIRSVKIVCDDPALGKEISLWLVERCLAA